MIAVRIVEFGRARPACVAGGREVDLSRGKAFLQSVDIERKVQLRRGQMEYGEAARTILHRKTQDLAIKICRGAQITYGLPQKLQVGILI